MLVEEISLSTTVDDLDPDQPAGEHEITGVLEQENRLRRGYAQFTLFNDHRLAVISGGVLQKARNFTIDTRILDPQPKRLLKICWRFILLALVLGGIAGLLFARQTEGLAFLAAFGAVLSLVTAVYRSYDRWVFYSRSGRVPLVVLCNRLPDPRSLEEFRDLLAQNIEEARDLQAGNNAALIDEMKAHRQLMEEGVISGKRYDIVKQRILSLHQ